MVKEVQQIVGDILITSCTSLWGVIFDRLRNLTGVCFPSKLIGTDVDP